MRGAESLYIFQMAFDQYFVNNQKLLHYAKRRGIRETIDKLIQESKQK